MSVQDKAIQTIRFLAIDGVQKANSGHPGMPMGCAPIGYTLFDCIMKHNPANPKWANRDRFVLSAGHGSMLLYSLLHVTGYSVSLNDLKQFRQWGSITPGHPEYGLTPGVETTTGPLGQGFSNAVGFAIARDHVAARFNKPNFPIVNHSVYGICSDGDLMEGISHEAASLAGHLCLANLIIFYDDNGITIDGLTKMSFSEDVEKRFLAYGWNVECVQDGNDTNAILDAVSSAKKSGKPTLVKTKTIIGFGSPNKQGTPKVHGSPLGKDEIALTKKNLGWEYDEPFTVPSDVAEYFAGRKAEYAAHEVEWNVLWNEYAKSFPEDAEAFLRWMGTSSEGSTKWEITVPHFNFEDKPIATRSASQIIINAIAPQLPVLFGGSADLAASNLTMIKDGGAFSAENRSGRNIFYGIREHAMGAVMNGIALYGGLIPFGGTFLTFSDYVRPAIRLASLSHINVIYAFTHDSIGVGEDGPTHQPIEHLPSLRAIPGLVVLRPADANETAAAWKFAVEHKHSPVALLLTRQDLPILRTTQMSASEGVCRGAYIVRDFSEKPSLILMASGSETQAVLDAAELLAKNGVFARVVSFPSWELFEAQPEEYKKEVLPPDIKIRVAVEAAIMQGWERYTAVSQTGSLLIGMESYGASAPAQTLFEKFGLTPKSIAERTEQHCKNFTD